MSDDELKKAINKHFVYKNCACCGYVMTQNEQNEGNLFCFDCVNEQSDNSTHEVNPIDFDNEGGYDEN